MTSEKQTRLRRLLDDTLRDSSRLTNIRLCSLFLEALHLCPNAVEALDKIDRSPQGYDCIRRCLQLDYSQEILNGLAADLLDFFHQPEVAAIDDGNVLRKLLKSVIEPSFFWRAFTKALLENKLRSKATHALAWVLTESLRLSVDDSAQMIHQNALDEDVLRAFSRAEDGRTRALGDRIKELSAANSSSINSRSADGPGGRHDNDFEQIRNIRILPTADELNSSQRPFIRQAEELDLSKEGCEREFTHLDNQFRLLREDMISELREEIQCIQGKRPKRHRGISLHNAQVLGVSNGVSSFQSRPWQWQPWSLRFVIPTPLPGLRTKSVQNRKSFLSDAKGDGSKILRKDSLVAILRGDQINGYGQVDRDVDGLALDRAEIALRLDPDSVQPILDAVLQRSVFTLVQVDTAVFAYEPFLKRLKAMESIPLARLLLDWKPSDHSHGRPDMSSQLRVLMAAMDKRKGTDIKELFGSKTSITLDDAQSRALSMGLSQSVSLIQGPPGTGKSFIGALLAKALYDNSDGRVLVITYTNHALDQFAGDLMDVGVNLDNMVRLGSKSSDRTAPIMLQKQKSSYRLDRNDWAELDELRDLLRSINTELYNLFGRFTAPPTYSDIMDLLQFEVDDLPFYDAFTVPKDDGNFQKVGKNNQAIRADYLFSRWKDGENAGVFLKDMSTNSARVWTLPGPKRLEYLQRWQTQLRLDIQEEIKSAATKLKEGFAQVRALTRKQDESILKAKRFILCTTTGAANLADLICQAAPEVVLVEEAGEILESHVITAMSSSTKRLILIGDHKQLRPKVANYELSVEQGSGYDLNRSLFERLILRGYPHATLSKQHRMRPAISAIIRHLTYHELEDATSTTTRSNVRGIRGNVIFVDHDQPESTLENSMERDRTTSKENRHEANLILKYVKNLAQQGYGSKDVVVLTPYLGQLRLLQNMLRKDHDPVLSDLDQFDLRKAGLLTDIPANKGKQFLKLSTIDNYQGEESKIVIISMTRSNQRHDIGFMSAPERLNVLLSRARDGMIVIGNMQNFANARSGKENWAKLVDFVKDKGYLHTGLPVRCQVHKHREALLEKPEDFDEICPDGGCSAPCDEILSCKVHKCPSRCHILSDHSKVLCQEVLSSDCPQGHTQTWKCYQKPPLSCKKCHKETEKRRKEKIEALVRQERRDEEQAKHAAEMALLEKQIIDERQRCKDELLKVQRSNALAQKRQDLASTKAASHEQQQKLITAAANQIGKLGSFLPQIASVFGSESSQAEPAQSPPSAKRLGPSAATKQNPNSSTTSNASDSSNSSDTIESQNQTPNLLPAVTPVKSEDLDPSQAKADWENIKQVDGVENDAIDKIMDLVGLEDVKRQVLELKAQLELAQRQNTSMSQVRLNMSFLGNPGTGKTTVARLMEQVFRSLKVFEHLGDSNSAGFVETSGSKLASEGVSKVEQSLKSLVNGGGGVFFIDEAYQLTNTNSTGGKAVLDFLLTELENLTGKVVFILAGYTKPMEDFFGHNPGLSSRVPNTLRFIDYNDKQLRLMLSKLFRKRFHGRAEIHDGEYGLFTEILCKRLGRGRGHEGFGNMRDLENRFDQICKLQARRIERQRRQGSRPNDFYFTQEDIIGPEPSQALVKCEAWKSLQGLTGLDAVKDQVSGLFRMLSENYLRDLRRKEPQQLSLNKVFLGSPGTGKTTVAKLYGQILANLGLLSKGEVVVKTPADFIGAYIGHSAQNTKKILESSKGKVLVIDEAYMLDPQRSDSNGAGASHTDPFRTEVIDVLVSLVQGVPGDDQCVLMLGYKNEMSRMFENSNPGFARRFPLDDAFTFEDFTDSQLEQILQNKLRQHDYVADDHAVSVALQVLDRARSSVNFGNAGTVENLITTAKVNRQNRMKSSNLAPTADVIFEAADFDPDWDRARLAGQNLRELFKNVVGSDKIIAQMGRIQKVAAKSKAKGLDWKTLVPTNFIFKGPPGTGKTTTARKIGQVFYDLGLLSKAEVVECSVTDLVAPYVGQTGSKTRKQLTKGLGKVLFVDEAYRLAEQSHSFTSDAVNEIVDCLTKPEFKGKLVVILAGYEGEMNQLLQVNPGLASRFSETVSFDSLQPHQCTNLLLMKLKDNNISCPVLSQTSSREYNQVQDLFSQFSQLRSWGNGRDVQTIAQKIMQAVFEAEDDQEEVPGDAVISCLMTELNDRRRREPSSQPAPLIKQSPVRSAKQSPPPQSPPQPPSSATAKPNSARADKISEDSVQEPSPGEGGRDADVDDETWRQLQADILAEQKAKEQAEKTLKAQKERQDRLQAELEESARRHKEAQDKANAAAAEEKRAALEALEAARLAEIARQARLEEERRRLEKIRKQRAEEQRKEAAAQAKLRDMGVCCQGFRWIKQANGYRCAGGAHFVHDRQLGI